MDNTMDAALKHAQSRAQYMSRCSSTYIIHIALKELGIPSESESFYFAKNAVRFLCENPETTLTHGIYVAVGALNNPTVSERSVENAIRRAIQIAWKNRDEKTWQCYFQVGRAGRTECPSNKEFLAAIRDFVELWKAFCEEVNYVNT